MQAVYLWLWRLIPGNPQIVRIVQGASRRNKHAFVRLAYIVVLIAIVLAGLIFGGGLSGGGDLSDLAKAGAQVFRIVAMGQVILVCLIAPIFMAGAIASEQSGKTYNILLTTPLSNLQIVLGSLVGRLFFILALLFSGLPLFAVMLIFGGVPVTSIFVAFMVAAMTAVFVGAVAVMLSVLRAGGRKAVFAFVVTVAAYLVIVGALDLLLLRNLGPNPGHTTVLTPVHPLLVLNATINQANYQTPGPEELAGYPGIVRFYLGSPFAAFTTITAGLSLAIVLFCSIWVRAIGAGDNRFILWLKQKLRLAGGRQRKARSLGKGNPIAWREANTRGRMAGGIIARYGFIALGLIGLLILLSYYHNDPTWTPATDAYGVELPVENAVANPDDPDITPPEWFRKALAALLITEIAVISLVAIYMAAGCVSKEREDGTLDIMLTTPITPKNYIWGKLRGLIRFLSVMIALPVATLLIVAIYTVVGNALGWPQTTVMQHWQGTTTSYGSTVGTSTPAPLLYFESFLLLLIMLLPFIAVCVAFGMKMSLQAKGVLGAIIPSIAVIGGGAVLFGFCGFFAARGIPFVGETLNAFSPSTNVIMLVDPYNSVYTFNDQGPTAGRVTLFFAASIAACAWGAVVWGLIASMVNPQRFDQTVRRLSGTK